MSSVDYFAAEGVNWSRLKWMRDSPKAYRHAVLVGFEDSDTLRSGRLLHTLVLEPGRVDLDYAVWRGKVRNGKAWEQFEADNAARCIVTPSQFAQAEAMAAAVLESPEAMQYLGARDAIFERVMQWVDDDTGLSCKARADIIVPGMRVLADLKGAVSADARRFGNAAARYGYHCQAAHYGKGVAATYGWAPEQTKLIVVEKAAPHDVSVFDVGADDITAGREEVAHLLRRVRECADADHWPGRHQGEQALQLPTYITAGELEFEYE